MSEEISKPIHHATLIQDNMKESYLRYSMSVIVSRALPDVRDGLKPVHRRVLFGMHELGVYPGKPYKKSARIVGDVIGKYHPHGDTAVYDTIVRMAQDFSLRYPLVDGQGNFGSIDGDSAAAMRYTEARMAKFGEMMLEDLEKETVNYNPNYDDSLEEPTVMPSAFPNLLVNGSTGIAVGMATSMAPHNLTEMIRAIKAVIENPDIAIEDLLQYVTGPDFPTGGIICGRSGIRSAYLTGRGKVRVRAKAEVETLPNGRERIIVNEIPYMVNKAGMIERMAQLVRDKKLEGISDLRDESDRDGIRIVIEIRKDAMAEVVLNQLYKYTQLQDTFSIYNLALVKKEPKLLNLKELIAYYIEHRHEVLVRKTQFELRKAKDRAHILEGYRIALQNIEEVIKVIRSSPDTETAKNALEARFGLSDKQSAAIVEMRLRALTGLEMGKIEHEYQELLKTIADFEDILARKERRMQIIATRLDEIEAKFGDPRRTAIEDAVDDIDIEDLIADEPQVISLSHSGYIKRLNIDTYKSQARGGRGVSGSNLKELDYIKMLFVASSHDYLLVFTDMGRVYWMKVYHIPESSRTGRGKAIVNLIKLKDDEKVSALVPVREFKEGMSVILCTQRGVINKMDLSHFSRPRKDGINAMNLDEGDHLITALVTEDSHNIMLATQKGQAICFPPSAFRFMGRGTRGVRGINLAKDDLVIGMILHEENTMVLTVTENGFAKRTDPAEYRVTNRGGKGIRNIKVTDKNGLAVGISEIQDDDDIILSTRSGMVIRVPASQIRIIGRASQGVRLIRLKNDDVVTDVAYIPAEFKDDEESEIPEDMLITQAEPEEDDLQDDLQDETSEEASDEVVDPDEEEE
jgi:DNA gyrase subunit A